MAQKRYAGTKYSFENPEVWVPSPEESASKEISLLINLFKNRIISGVKDAAKVLAFHSIQIILNAPKSIMTKHISPAPVISRGRATFSKELMVLTFAAGANLSAIFT